MSNDSNGWFDKTTNVRWIVRALVAVCVVLIGLELVVHKHGHFGFEEIPAFHALFGFVAFIVAVYAGKLLRALLSRDEDYYDR